MRFDTRRAVPAATLINELDEDALIRTTNLTSAS